MLSWVWIVIGLSARLVARLTVAEGILRLVLDDTPLLYVTLYSAARYVMYLVPKKGSPRLQFLIVLTLTLLTSSLPAVVHKLTSADSSSLADPLSPRLLGACLATFLLCLYFEAEALVAKTLLAARSGSWYLAVFVVEEISARVLVVPYQVKRCRLKDRSQYQQMFPFVIVQ
jgi:hypothetical protein